MSGSPSSSAAEPAASDPSSAAEPCTDARIIDRGYRAYEGARLGLPGAIRSVVLYSARYSLGMGRSARHKILPGIVIAISLGPAVFIALLSVMFNRIGLLHGETPLEIVDYYWIITFALVFFCGIVVPDILVSDRRNGMLPMYMSTPLQRWSYLLAKVLAVALTLSIVAVLPVLFLMLAYTFQGVGPDGFAGWLLTFARIIAAGVVVSAGFTAASLAAASLTNRRAFASIGVILLLFSGGAFADALTGRSELRQSIHALDLLAVTGDLVRRIYGESAEPSAESEQAPGEWEWEWEAEVSGADDPGERPSQDEWPGPAAAGLAEDSGVWGEDSSDPDMELGVGIGESSSPMSDLSTLFVVLAYLGWVSVGSAVVWLRYRRLAVSL